MNQERQTGAARALAEPALDARDLTVRLVLAERAIAETTARVAELTDALARLTGETQPPVHAKTPPLHIDADAVTPFALGFYQREFDKVGRPFRWTGKSEIFEMRIRLNRSAAWSFAMEVQGSARVDAKKLRAFVDYAEIPVAVDEAGKVVTGTIPERYFGTMATLSFLLPATFVPASINPAVQDPRTLGVMFYDLRLSPVQTAIDAAAASPRVAVPGADAHDIAAAPKARAQTERTTTEAVEASR